MATIGEEIYGLDTSVTVIEAQTAGATSGWFTLPEGCAMTFFCDTLAGSETVKVQIQKPDGTGLDVTSGGSPVQLDATSNTEALYAKGVYRLVKSSTSGSVGVYAFGKPFRKC